MAKESEPIRLVLELEPESDPIRGSVRSDEGVRPFGGWMELTAAIEEARLGGNRLVPVTRKEGT